MQVTHKKVSHDGLTTTVTITMQHSETSPIRAGLANSCIDKAIMFAESLEKVFDDMMGAHYPQTTTERDVQ